MLDSFFGKHVEDTIFSQLMHYVIHLKMERLFTKEKLRQRKNQNHNLNLLNYFPLFHSLGFPICAGLSRKSLIDNIYKDKYKSDISPNERLSGSLSLQNIAFLNGAQIIRTHDVFEVQQSFACLEEVYI